MSDRPTSVLRSAFLTVSMRWIDRLIGIVSTIVLARILVPEDFGIVALAMLVIGLAEVLLDMGVHIALLQNQSPTTAHYHTAWTIRLIQSVLIIVLVLAAAPFAAAYFEDARLVLVLQVMSLMFLLQGLENIWIVTFQKEMRFDRDFRFMFTKRISGFLVTMILAVLTGSYWAMVIGGLAGRAVGVLLSYRMHPGRVRLSFEKFADIFGISQWMLVQSIGRFLNTKLHEGIVGRREDVSTFGAYSLAWQIGSMPTSEVLAPLNRVLFPLLVSVKNDLLELRRLMTLALGVQALIAMPAGVGLAMVAPDAVRLLLGEKWMMAVPFVQSVSLLSIIVTISTSGAYVLLTLGKTKIVGLYPWVQVAAFALLALVVFPEGNAQAVIWQRLAVAAGGLILFMWLLMRELPGLTLSIMIGAIIRPVLGVILMAAMLWEGSFNDRLSISYRLATDVIVGAAVYLITVIGLWRLSGSPVGAEKYLLGKCAGAAGLVVSRLRVRRNANR